MSITKSKPKRYSAEYYYLFFKSIPPKKWTTGTFERYEGNSVTKCAVGHCGFGSHKAGMLCRNFPEIFGVNDAGNKKAEKLGKHPRTRVLRFFRQKMKEEAKNSLKK